MKKFVIILTILLTSEINGNSTPIDSLIFGPFGKVIIYKPAKVPESVVLFVSGDGGWNMGVIEMAKKIAEQGALVAGIDILHYGKKLETIHSKCQYPASDFENLSLIIQKKYKFKQYLKPILVGYSSGATLVYGILAQAPANTFKGAISLGFCPDIEMDRPLCNGSGLSSHVLKEGSSYYLEASKQLTAPFIVLQGIIDQVCSYTDTKKYMENMPMGEIISLPKVGHGFSVAKNWLPQFIEAYQKVQKEPTFIEKKNTENKLLLSQNLAPMKINLPLILIPTSSKENQPLTFFISGDGGWTSFDHAVCEKIAAYGMPVVGLDAQKYFWAAKTPKEASDDIANAIFHYMVQWNRTSFILAGYSFGACVAPFIANNFPAQLKETLKGVFCFSPDKTGDFEIHIADMLSISTNEEYDVLSEMKKIEPLNPVCVFGKEEDNELIKYFSVKGIKIETLPGNHHYNEDYSAVSELVFEDYLRNK